jgi:hypothetical protein
VGLAVRRQYLILSKKRSTTEHHKDLREAPMFGWEEWSFRVDKGGDWDTRYKNTNERSTQMATDQISFYDQSLKKQIEGSYVSDGKAIHVSSVYGVKSAPYNDLGACIDYNAQVLLAQKLLSELARDAAKDTKSH